MRTILASELTEDMLIPGVDAYVVEVETGDGYLSYPSTDTGMNAAMPVDTILVTYHDSNGNENYLLLDPECRIEVRY